MEYKPKARCPKWLKFLGTIFAGDAEVIPFVQRFLGYCLTGSVREQVLPIFHGGGENGKSTLLNAVRSVLGPDYSMKAQGDFFCVRYGERHSTEMMDLHGKRFVQCSETDEGRSLAEGLMKDLTGGEPVRGRRMREDNWEFEQTCKFILATNHKPRIRHGGHATWRRLVLVPFNVQIPPKERDRDLPEKLGREAEGILAWLVEGCREWQHSGLSEPKAIVEATGEYRRSENTVGRFVNEWCDLKEGETIQPMLLYTAYQRWCKINGERPEPSADFKQRAEEFGLKQGRTKIKRFWCGIRLKRGMGICSEENG